MGATWTPRGRVTGTFARGVKEGELRLHPQIGGLVEKGLLEKMGASAASRAERAE